MGTFKTSLLIAVISVFIFTGSIYAAEQLKITVFTDATWPPMEMVDKNKNIVGFEMQVFDLIFKLVFDFLGGYSNTIKKRFSPSIRIPPQKNDYFV